MLDINDPEVYAEVLKAVEVSARRYAKRVWWVDEADLQQQAWLLALKVIRSDTYDEDIGVPLAAFLMAILTRQLHTYVCKQSSIASASRRHVKELKGHTRVWISPNGDIYQRPTAEAKRHDKPVSAGPSVIRLNDTSPSPERQEQHNQIYRIVKGLVDERTLQLGLPVLLREHTCNKVAEDTGADIEDVRKASKTLRRLCNNNMKLWRIWTTLS